MELQFCLCSGLRRMQKIVSCCSSTFPFFIPIFPNGIENLIHAWGWGRSVNADVLIHFVDICKWSEKQIVGNKWRTWHQDLDWKYKWRQYFDKRDYHKKKRRWLVEPFVCHMGQWDFFTLTEATLEIFLRPVRWRAKPSLWWQKLLVCPPSGKSINQPILESAEQQSNRTHMNLLDFKLDMQASLQSCRVPF